ncbi:Asparaginase [Sulfidibacter corallicola]|uniref:Asparaginase n=1 Tax=Sulfidibacter corallicola TaxID=2818388 RepID=A0A8A4TE23_SULCO|nr:asparaginase [Sulfidibacter corallicola]QTD47883.1 asparaginase [Sulfidibacter corallicola]
MSENANRKHVLVLSTGGTLGMRAQQGGPLEPDQILQNLAYWIPELEKYAAFTVEIVANLDSSQLTPSIWLKLATRIERAQENGECDGIVVLHGTDTLAFTASALSFLLPGLTVPVVLTGGQRPLAELRTDARNNVLGAFETALEGPVEVMVFFHNTAYRGNRATKSAIGDFDGFNSPNYPALGRAGISWEWNEALFWPQTRRPTIYRPIPGSLPSAPWVLPWVPGLDFESLAPALEHQWGVILEAFGTGNMPFDKPIRDIFAEFIEKGGMVFIRSQVPRGRVMLGTYAPGRAMLEMGVGDGLDMTREAMVTKLMVLKSYGLAPEKIKSMISKNIAGELADSH